LLHTRDFILGTARPRKAAQFQSVDSQIPDPTEQGILFHEPLLSG